MLHTHIHNDIFDKAFNLPFHRLEPIELKGKVYTLITFQGEISNSKSPWMHIHVAATESVWMNILSLPVTMWSGV